MLSKGQDEATDLLGKASFVYSQLPDFLKLTLDPDQAQEMHKYIRDLLVEQFGGEVAENMTILYGGSCKPSNAEELFANPDVDGGLIGGASLKAEDFLAIVNSY